MNKTVAVVGFTFTHYSFYMEVIKVFQDAGYRVTFYTDLKTANCISDEQVKYLSLNSMNLIVFKGRIICDLYKCRRSINKHDVVFWDEYYGQYLYLVLLKISSKKRVLGVHNIHKYLYLSNGNILHYVNSFFRRWFFCQFGAVVVISTNLKNYLISSRSDVRTFVIPFSGRLSPNQLKSELDESVIKIVVPGSVENSRRNYKDLLLSFLKYLRLGKDPKIQLVLLGQLKVPKTDQVYQMISEVKSKYTNNLMTWNDFVPISEYENHMIEADYLLSNVNLVSNKTSLFEVYGLSKETGVSFAAYKYQKPGIFPIEQRVSPELESQLIRYSGYHELVDVFLRIDAGEYDYLKLKSKAQENSKVYDVTCDIERDAFIGYLCE